MIDIRKIPVTPIQQNCRLIVSTATHEAVLIDPGGDAEKIFQAIKVSGATLKGIWLTHSHFDHCGGVAAVRKVLPVELWGHADAAEKKYRENVEQVCKLWNLPIGDMSACPEPEHYLEGGETVRVGALEFKVLFVPGHSPGHVCFYHAPSKTLIAGDTLFAGSIGRTDLPFGDHELLIAGISRELLTLPGDTAVMPGHGPDTTIEIERATNPFLKG